MSKNYNNAYKLVILEKLAEGYRIKALSEKYCVHPSSIYSWAKAYPNLDKLRAIAEAEKAALLEEPKQVKADTIPNRVMELEVQLDDLKREVKNIEAALRRPLMI